MSKVDRKIYYNFYSFTDHPAMSVFSSFGPSPLGHARREVHRGEHHTLTYEERANHIIDQASFVIPNSGWKVEVYDKKKERLWLRRDLRGGIRHPLSLHGVGVSYQHIKAEPYLEWKARQIKAILRRGAKKNA